VVAGDHQERQPEPAQELRRGVVLAAQAAMRQVAARDDERRLDLLDQPRERLDGLGGDVPAEVEVGDVEDPRRHEREAYGLISAADAYPFVQLVTISGQV
jgi:hypothetical protein